MLQTHKPTNELPTHKSLILSKLKYSDFLIINSNENSLKVLYMNKDDRAIL